MAYDEGLAQIMRDDLCDVIGISEKKMFGGLAFSMQVTWCAAFTRMAPCFA